MVKEESTIGFQMSQLSELMKLKEEGNTEAYKELFEKLLPFEDESLECLKSMIQKHYIQEIREKIEIVYPLIGKELTIGDSIDIKSALNSIAYLAQELNTGPYCFVLNFSSDGK